MSNNLFNLLLAPSERPKWIADSFPIIQGIIIGLICLISIIMIVAILVSPPDNGTGTNAITGASESYYTKNRNKNNLGRIRNLIIICACTIAVLTIIFFIMFGIFNTTGTAE
ncbi:MAG: hypothetical protein KIG16_01860 [Eubacteriales bacterium]|nr:hypothetical protein [Eubacteriales bacterium]